MSQELKQQLEPAVQEKFQVWGSMGVAVHQQEMQLQAMAQESIQKLHLPTKIEEVKECEELLAELKRDASSIQQKRKEITGKFDKLTERLMLPEKSLLDPIKELSGSIIKIKKVEQDRLAKEKAKNDELKQLKEYVLKEVARIDAEYKHQINTSVNNAYKRALETNVNPADINNFIMEQVNKVSPKHFTISINTPKLINATIEDFDPIVKENCNINFDTYLKLIVSELNNRFSDYEVAYLNKAQALEIAKKESEQKLAAIQMEQQNKEIAAKLESISSPLQTSTSFKELKKSYEVDMPENIESVLAIMGAFAANIEKCMPKLKVNKWFSFTPAQAATALSKVKCDDNNFQPSGIEFKTVEKL